MPSEKTDQHRLFFALWPPDEELRQALAALARPYVQTGKGRAVAAANLHLTLAFLGEIAAPRRDCLIHQAAAIQARAFELRLDCVCNWRHNGILWVGASETDTALEMLVRDLQKIMRACGLKPEKRAFQAHITLMRQFYHGPIEPLPIPPLLWPARDFALVESLQRDGRTVYEVLCRRPLVSRET